MHTVFALLCFVVVIHWLIFPYPSGLLHWHCGNLTIAPVPAKQPWWIWINTSCEFIMNDCITTTKQSTTKPCAYFLGYTVYSPVIAALFTKCNTELSFAFKEETSHYDHVIMDEIASQITSLKIVYSAVYLDADQRKHQSSASLAFVRGIHRGPVNSPHKWPVTRKMFPFDDVIMLKWICILQHNHCSITKSFCINANLAVYNLPIAQQCIAANLMEQLINWTIGPM